MIRGCEHSSRKIFKRKHFFLEKNHPRQTITASLSESLCLGQKLKADTLIRTPSLEAADGQRFGARRDAATSEHGSLKSKT